MIDKETAKNILHFGIVKDIKYLFKYLLEVIDDLEREGSLNANNKDYFRKKILGQGNDALRNLEKNLAMFEINVVKPVQDVVDTAVQEAIQTNNKLNKLTDVDIKFAASSKDLSDSLTRVTDK